MGGERIRTRKLLRILAATFIILSFFSCAGTREVREQPKEEIKVSEPPIEAEEEEDTPQVVAETKAKIEETPEEQKKKEEALRQERRAKQIADSLFAAKKLLDQGDFDGSVKKSQKSLSMAGRTPPGDEALFTMALAYVHYRNPKKDYARAMTLFERLPKEYPESPLADQARTWVDVLQIIEKLKRVDIDIEEKRKGLAR
jgi:TolA-binding protein